jgi:Trp operon repressor
MLNCKLLNKLYRLIELDLVNITCQKDIIKEIYKKILTMDKKTQIKDLIQKIKEGLKANNPINDIPENWIGISTANQLTGITRPTLYNIVAEEWVASKKGINNRNQEATLIYKPHLMTYNLQYQIIQDLVDAKYIKEDIDQITGKKRWLQIQLDRGGAFNLDGEVKLQALFKIHKSLQDLFQNVNLEEFSESN